MTIGVTGYLIEGLRIISEGGVSIGLAQVEGPVDVCRAVACERCRDVQARLEDATDIHGVEVHREVGEPLLVEVGEELIRRRYTEGATLKSIAAQSGQSENSIKQALFRARAALIECVKRQRPEEAI